MAHNGESINGVYLQQAAAAAAVQHRNVLAWLRYQVSTKDIMFRVTL